MNRSRTPLARSSAPDRPIDEQFGRLNCEHIAVLLKSTDELPAVLASFLGLGAARNGWLVHGSLPGQADVDQSKLTEAGLDVASLTATGQLDIMELDLTVSPEEWVQPWSLRLDQRMEEGYDALWFARFPIEANVAQIREVLPFEEVWMRSFAGRQVVTLCPYIFGDMAAEIHTARLREVSSVHDRVIDMGSHAGSGSLLSDRQG